MNIGIPTRIFIPRGLLAILVVVGIACGGPEPALTIAPEIGPAPATVVSEAPGPGPSPTITVTMTVMPEPSPTVAVAITQMPDPSPTVGVTPTARVIEPTPTSVESGRTPLVSMTVERVFPNLTFRRSTNMVQPDDGRGMLFVTEQSGIIRSFPNRQDVAETGVFLDITDRVSEGGNEEGLLGLAFAPDFEESGYFYVYYSARDPRRSVVSRFKVSRNDPGQADPASELIIMEVPQPASNHNGGQLAFGPDDYLYIALGDGGRGGDPFGNGQDTATLLGSILRIDVLGASEEERYSIPSDNPFVGVSGALDEVWAYGLRNPWRFSFDRETGRMWVGDVGQNEWEEVNLVEKGLNYGWNVMEGAHCFLPRTGCDGGGLQLPVAEYSSDEGCSIIGGYVYPSGAPPSLTAAYIYGDFCSGKIWGLRHDGRFLTEHALLVDSDLRITTFGFDQSGEVYILSRDSGIYRMVPE